VEIAKETLLADYFAQNAIKSTKGNSQNCLQHPAIYNAQKKYPMFKH
jgi:hypothetical protein